MILQHLIKGNSDEYSFDKNSYWNNLLQCLDNVTAKNLQMPSYFIYFESCLLSGELFMTSAAANDKCCWKFLADLKMKYFLNSDNKLNYICKEYIFNRSMQL